MTSKFMVVLAAIVLAGCGGPQTPQSGSSQAPSVPRGQTAALKNQTHIDQGLMQLQGSNIPGAIKSFDEAIKQNPMNPEGYLVLGQTYLRLKEYDRAIDTFSAATRVAPQEGEIYYLLAVSHGLAGNGDLARENAERSIEIFQGQKNEEKFVRSVALLKGLTDVE